MLLTLQLNTLQEEAEEQGARGSLTPKSERDKQKGIVPHLNASHSKEWGIEPMFRFATRQGRRSIPPTPYSLLPSPLLLVQNRAGKRSLYYGLYEWQCVKP
jgi:hypothetical protein